MNVVLDKTKIKKLCGDAAYKKGKSYFLSGKVELEPRQKKSPSITGTVKAGSLFQVTVQSDFDEQIEATCSCPPVGFIKTYCQHIAAVLLAIEEQQRAKNPMADRMLGLFGNQPVQPSGKQLHFDKRQTLHVEFLCSPIDLGAAGFVIGVRLNVGDNSLERIEEPLEFLRKVGMRQPFEYCTGRIYNPERHNFSRETDAVLRLLTKMQPIKADLAKGALLISAAEWEMLLPLLEAAPAVAFEQNGRLYDGVHYGDRLPLSFELDTAEAGYRLEMEGLERITVFESYSYAFSKGHWFQMEEEDCGRLAELKKMFGETGKQELLISEAQISHFRETAISGLMRIGQVDIAERASRGLKETPLTAKLFLDRVNNRLLAGLEFHYGRQSINPCEEMEQGYQYLPGVRRQLEKEQRILKKIQDSQFTQTPGGFYLQDEEAEYDFLYHAVPELEELVKIYATTSVKLRVQKAYMGPKIKVEVKERTDWLSFRFDMKEIPEKEIQQLLKAIAEKRKYYRVPNGTLMSLETPEFWAMGDFIGELGLSTEELDEEEIRVPLIHGMQLAEGLEESGLAEPGETFAKLMKNLADPGKLDEAVPKSLEPVLRDYQKTGFSWMKLLAAYRFGGILADDMGLGKTLQSIAYIVSVLPEVHKRQQPVLVVCPSSLVYNWLNELEKFAPEIQAKIIDGNRAARVSALKNLTGFDVVITSYPSLRMDGTLYRDKQFHTVFFDEAQAFKNPVTQTAKAVKAIQADYRFALTGTPIENSLDELWSIFRVVFPELLPNRQAFNELRRQNVAKRIRPFILRRTKKEVLGELPEKIETVQFSELQTEQKKLYAAYLAELKHDALKHLTKGSFRKNRIKILAGLTRLRQICCHPALFVEGYAGGSAKFDQLMEIVEECRLSGRRVLIFSQFTQMLGIIGRKLGRHGLPYFYLDGQTPPSERVAMCERFNEGEGNLFLISLKAGGTGLNLTGADTVILYDLWWNPAVEQQAADRAHRMGQKNEVQVIRMLAKGTIEEKISELQEKKKNLIDQVIHSGQESLTALTEQDIREILMIK
ncbi:DEAD/DEAH box helicase [Planococcus shenhongbingii]|uniref:SNF2 helicase associated domain-containing protein n=1 Tax=Planococcus shenhongbingii TaxID=3058398 RepID=A0ABT8NC30_9BACL|nr:SNF2 helicase associated domain-containing protein [Planococcus sp. N017]MDN7245406.1 SNF2 helicase associated domain-containing protein [Planococcus sp. N017]